MNEDEVADILAAHRQNMDFDLVQGYQKGRWGAYWAVPPCSPEAMQGIARQFRRTRANRLRYIRRARLRCGSDCIVVSIVTAFPSKEQFIYRIDDGKRLYAPYLNDETLTALEAALLSTEQPR